MDSPAGPPRILLVDDNLDNLALVRLLLERDHYRVETATDGHAAVRRFREVPCDLVLMDLAMPGLDGCEAAQAMREQERVRKRPAVPILILTAHDHDAYRRRCLASGCDDFLVKPLRRDALREILARYLEEPADQPNAPTTAPNPADMESLRPLFPVFFATVETALRDIGDALATGEMATVRLLGHRIKGSARTYGFAELGEAGACLEQAGAAHDGTGIAAALETAQGLLAEARKAPVV